MGTIGVTNSSNFNKLKFAKFWTNFELFTLYWSKHLHFILPFVQCLVLTHCIKQLQYINTCKHKNNLILNTHPLKHLFVIIWWKTIRITHVQIGIIAKKTMKYKKNPKRNFKQALKPKLLKNPQKKTLKQTLQKS